MTLASRLLFAAAAGWLAAAATLCAGEFAEERLGNWHQWRGPSADGVSPRGDPPVAWDETTNIKWKVPIPGRGSSTPIVWGDQVFLLTAIRTDRVTDRRADRPPLPPLPEEAGDVESRLKPLPVNAYKFVVLSVDRATGRTRWRRVASEHGPHRGHHRDHGYASGSPTTDGRRLYASFGSNGIYCFDIAGEPKWHEDLGDMEVFADFGEAVTPVLHSETLVVNWDHLGQSFLVALDAETGRMKWKVNREEISNWSTPLVVDHNGRTQVIVNGYQRTRSYDLKTGGLIWECGGQGGAIIPTPVSAGGVVYCMTGYRGNMLSAIRLDSSGDVTGSEHVVWQRTRSTPYVPSPLLYDGLLYFNRSNRGILSCLRASTGEEVFADRRVEELVRIYASGVAAAGRVYFVGRDGTTVVLRHGGEFQVLATNTLDEPIDASPAVVDGEMFLRGAAYLYCIAAD